MTLYKKWLELANVERTEDEYNEFWEDYLPKEQSIYQDILNNNGKLEGLLSELANKYSMNNVTFTGFLDGINSSLNTNLELDKINENSDLCLSVDFEKLYYNMLDAKADWLYNLEEWDSILSDDERKEIKKSYNKTRIVVKDKKINRNDPCPCGSGKKFKKCCL